MKTQALLFALLAPTLFATACAPIDDKQVDPPTTCTSECEPPEHAPVLLGSFVSGHLGNYWDCPEQGYSESGEARNSSDAEFAPCATTDPGCGGPLNCEGAQLTVRLQNDGDLAATGVTISKIEIFDADGTSLAELPIIAVVSSDTGEPFGTTLAEGADVTVRVDFQGPADLYSMLDGNGDSAQIEITVSAENHDDVVIDGKEVFVLPAVAT